MGLLGPWRKTTWDPRRLAGPSHPEAGPSTFWDQAWLAKNPGKQGPGRTFPRGQGREIAARISLGLWPRDTSLGREGQYLGDRGIPGAGTYGTPGVPQEYLGAPKKLPGKARTSNQPIS